MSARWPLTPALEERAARLAERPRALLGITGAPGSGKSTLAETLHRRLTECGLRAALVGMDGFHLAHRALAELGLVEVKGAPETFDVAGYVALLRRLREPTGDVVWAPEFRREIEDAVQSCVPVRPEVRLVITEGNYLLLDGPWRPVRELLDEVWFVDVPEPLRHRRLVERHRRYGRGEQQARDRALGSDQLNARVVAATRSRADLIVAADAAG